MHRFAYPASLAFLLAFLTPAHPADFALPAAGEPASPLSAPPDAPGGEINLDGEVRRLLEAREAMPAEAFELEALAAGLGGDWKQAFAWVRNHIRLDAYAGALRGPEAVLAARGGNANDRAVLLKALLEAMGVKARLASASHVPAEVTGALVAASFAPRDGGADASAVVKADFLERVRARAGRDHALLTGALGAERLAAIEASRGADLSSAFGSHAWVQAEIDGAWTDLDTSLPDAEPGAALLPAESTSETPDETQAQTASFIVTASLPDGDKEVLNQTFPVAAIAGRSILLSFGPVDSGYAGALTGGGDVVPYLSIDGDGIKGETIPGGGGGGAFGMIDSLGEDEAPAAKGPSRVSLRMVLGGAGQAPIETTRILAQAGDDGALPADENGPVAWRTVHNIIVSNGGASPRSYATARLVAAHYALATVSKGAEGLTLDQMMWPVTVSNRILPLISERIFIEALNGDGIRAFVARPRITLVSLGPGADGRQSAIIDLALDGVSIVARDGTAEARRRLWYGVLESALETELGLARGTAMEAEGRNGISASTVLGDSALTVFDDASSLPGGAPEAMKSQAAGARIVVAGDAADAKVWWTIGPDGEARAIADPAMGSFIGGGNYVNASTGGARYVVTETAETLEQLYEASLRSLEKPPPSRCGGGSEYVITLSCVSIPASWAVGAAVAVGVTVAVIYAIYSFASV